MRVEILQIVTINNAVFFLGVGGRGGGGCVIDGDVLEHGGRIHTF